MLSNQITITIVTEVLHNSLATTTNLSSYCKNRNLESNLFSWFPQMSSPNPQNLKYFTAVLINHLTGTDPGGGWDG